MERKPKATIRSVKLTSLDPNPWRDLKQFPLRETRVTQLAASIGDVHMWEGIIARPKGKRLQLAFGHHRIEAARHVGMKEVPIIVRELTDEEMIMFHARENLQDGESDFSIAQATWHQCRAYCVEKGIEPTPSTVARLAGFIDEAASDHGGDRHSSDFKLRQMSKLEKSGSITDSAKAMTANRTAKLMDRKLLSGSDLRGVSESAVRNATARAASRIKTVEASTEHTAAKKKAAIAQIGKAVRYALDDVRTGKIKASKAGATVDRIATITEKKRPTLDTYIRETRNLARRIGVGALDEHVRKLVEDLGKHGRRRKPVEVNILEQELLDETQTALLDAADRVSRLYEMYCNAFEISNVANVIEISEQVRVIGGGKK